MGIHAELVGNVLSSPTMKQVNTPSGPKRIVELRVMSAAYRRLDDGSVEQNDEKTFPVDVTVWLERLAERVMQHVKTGASVVVRGDLTVNPWTTRDQEPHAGVHIDADAVALNLVRVEQVIYRARQRREAETSSESPINEAAGPTEFDRPPDEGGAPADESPPNGKRKRRTAAAGPA